MSKGKKAELVQTARANNFTMEQLRQKILTLINQELQTNLAMSLSVTTLYLDRTAITNGIKAKAKHPISMMSGGMQYSSCAKESHNKVRKLEVLPEGTSENGISQNKIGPEQGNILDKWFNFMRVSGHEVATLEAEILELAEWIPLHTKDNLAMVRNSYDSLYSILDTLKQAGECNDFSAFIEGMCSFKFEFNTLIAGIKEDVSAARAVIQGILARIRA